MEIIVLTSGCSCCKSIYDDVVSAAKELSINAQIREVDDIVEALKYQVIALPAIIINGKAVLTGSKLSPNKIKELLAKEIGMPQLNS